MSFITKINSTDYTDRNITAGAGISVTNGDGVSGDVVISSASQGGSVANLSYSVSPSTTLTFILASTSAWNTTPINTIDNDADSIVSLSSDEFTLDAGTYNFSANIITTGLVGTALFFRIYDVTNSTVITEMVPSHLGQTTGSYTFNSATIFNSITITGTTTFRIEHLPTVSGPYYIGDTSAPTTTPPGADKKYLQLNILKIK